MFGISGGATEYNCAGPVFRYTQSPLKNSLRGIIQNDKIHPFYSVQFDDEFQ